MPEEQIKKISSVLTCVGGRVVHGAEEHGPLAPPMPPASPGWVPTAHFNVSDGAAARAALAGSPRRSALAGCDCFVL